MILVIDNYDSFTYNLVHLVGARAGDVRVIRNDALAIPAIAAMRPSHILLSPGPGRPENAGVCLELIRALGPRTPILGVCLGHQAIGLAFGATIIHAPELMHGKTSRIRHDGAGIFRSVPDGFEAGRYHSLVIAPSSVPESLLVTATAAENGVIMGVRHRAYPVEGIQFHPESILTQHGALIVANWLAAEWGTP